MYQSTVSTLKFSRGVGKMSFLSLLIVSLFMGTVVFANDTHAADLSKVHNNSASTVPLRWGPEGYDAYDKMRIPNGTAFRMMCWEDFKWYNGNYNSNRWFWGQEHSQGQYGYVHASYVNHQIPVPHC